MPSVPQCAAALFAALLLGACASNEARLADAKADPRLSGECMAARAAVEPSLRGEVDDAPPPWCRDARAEGELWNSESGDRMEVDFRRPSDEESAASGGN